MIDLGILEEHGCSPEKWKTLFQEPDKASKSPIVKKGVKPAGKSDKLAIFKDRLRSRVIAGRDYNITPNSWRVLHGLDLIWDAPFRQVSPTLLQSIISKHGTNKKQLLSALQSIGLDLDSMLIESQKTDPKTGKPIKAVSVPAFFAVMVPLVRSMLGARKAKLLNDRNQRPLIPFEPQIQNAENRTKADVVASRIQHAADQYNYLQAIDQGIHNMLLYPHAVMFTKEEWHYEEQMRRPVGSSKKAFESYVVKEGLRYEIPHPTRVYWDMAHPLRSLNTDTGCKWVGHWRIMRYGELINSSGFYNLDKIAIGATDWWSSPSVSAFFQSVYNTCALSVPVLEVPRSMDRETFLATDHYYSAAMSDKSVLVIEHREKVNPERDGLGTYPHDIWARFVCAGDGSIIYATPMGYTPAIVWKDNGDDRRIEEASMALLAAPYQDMMSNLLTQYLLSVKQNLANLTLFDKNVIEEKDMDWIRNLGENYFRALNINAFDSKKLIKQQNGLAHAIYSHRFPQMDTASLITAMRLVIDLAERILMFSSQEAGQAASHEQTREEIRSLDAKTTNIVDYTGVPVDHAMAAMGIQNYEAWMNYGEDDFTAELPFQSGRIGKDKLKSMGLTVLKEPYDQGDSYEVQGKKSAMSLLSFAYIPNTRQRITAPEAAGHMATFLRDLMANDMMREAIGADQALSMANEVAKMAGIRLPAKLKNTGMTADARMKQAQAIVEQVLAAIRPEMKQALLTIGQRLNQTDQAVAQLMQSNGATVGA